jgi:hypothetical protein
VFRSLLLMTPPFVSTEDRHRSAIPVSIAAFCRLQSHTLVCVVLHDAGLVAMPQQPAPADDKLAQIMADIVNAMPLPS